MNYLLKKYVHYRGFDEFCQHSITSDTHKVINNYYEFSLNF